MLAYTKEKLLFNYWDLNKDLYDALPENDERRHLPQSMSKDWDAFRALYKKTFGEDIGGRYNIICSLGIESEESNMNKFKFESEFVEVNDQVLKVYCE